MYVAVLSIMALAGIIVMLRRHIRRRKVKEMYCFIPARPVEKSCLTMTMQSCGPIIDKALECLSNNDNIAVCKNHRIGSQTIDIISDKVRNSSADTDDTIGKTALYCEYMLEATDKIAETTRHLVTSPDGYIPISYKCEIETIRGGIVRLSQLADSILSSDVDTMKINGDAGLEKDFIEHSIAVHSKGMTHEDFHLI
ncbi:hypothetical protein [uncultured Bacteroides sp.]|uniref:hypothetical protein n=1 Tax=uncultured Bacteroides sp. TaxID=162156 RepID=UPI0026E062A2|nr:hypothetical protein [uncultured Bacteroides sp.]